MPDVFDNHEALNQSLISSENVSFQAEEDKQREEQEDEEDEEQEELKMQEDVQPVI